LGADSASTVEEAEALLLQDEVDPIFVSVEGLELVAEELELCSFLHM
jgi:hypothetical protein